MGRMLPVFATPVLALVLVGWAFASRGLSARTRRLSMAAALLLTCGVFTLIRTGGITGEGDADLHWRWTPTPEDRLLAMEGTTTLTPAPAPAAAENAPLPAARNNSAATPAETDVTSDAPAERGAATPPPSEPVTVAPAAPTSATDVNAVSADAPRNVQWPGFRGPNRDSVVRGVRINTDWTTSPPVELWRKPVGPGWSSFAVSGGLVYTQEQRGDEELVSCYRLSSGEPVWRHRDAVRFYESNGGAGPRATPTVHDGRVYTMGATGIVNALDAATGALIWSRHAAADTQKQIPDWGVASSPVVMKDLVIVAVAGELVAYDVQTGEPRWFGPEGGGGYSSPHLATIHGVPQILLLRGARTIALSPEDGTLLWDHRGEPGVSIVQPALAGADVLIAGGDAMGGNGIRRVAVAHGADGWKAEERWMSRGLKPYFNDFVVHKGHAFGFDGSILAAIDLEDGTRKWKGGRYGHGQLILLPDQDVLLILSEDGELALVSATSDKHTEMARFRVLEGKTWNHPVIVGDMLLVRNGEEMAAFRLPIEGR
jgi:outer membrane protein assembly factor BamB